MKWPNLGSRLSVQGHVLVLSALTILQGCLTQAVALPPPTGKFNVGVSKHTIEHYNPLDPLAPNHVSTAFIATIYYPTLRAPVGPPQPYLEPELARIMEQQWNYSQGFLSTLTSTLQPDAPFLDGPVGESEFPTLLFGPGGGGPPVQGNTILISELVSYGYTVIGLDHPFEQPYIQYPNGTGVVGVDIDYNSTLVLDAIYLTRLVDISVFLDHFPKLVQELQAPINMTHLGAFGYSLGGAAAISSLYHSDRFVSGLNLDGGLYLRETLNDSLADTKKPVLFLGNELHTGQNEYDPSWETFPLWQTGKFRLFSINGSTHHDFCDDTFWKTIEPTDPSTGPIDGNRQFKILNAYVKAFFDLTLLGQSSPILDGPSAEWPEVVYYNY